MKQLSSENQLLQMPLTLAHILKQGSITLQTNGVESIRVTIQNNRIDYNFLQRELLRTLIELEAEITEKSLLERLKTLKNLAERLKQERLTVTISYKGQTLVTLGREAQPMVSQIVTGTNAIQINSMIELIRLISKQ